MQVPFLDICNTMLDPTLPLTTLDYEEFGDPRQQADFETIQSYSPYDNIRPRMCYPSVLVTASFCDSRYVSTLIFISGLVLLGMSYLFVYLQVDFLIAKVHCCFLDFLYLVISSSFPHVPFLRGIKNSLQTILCYFFAKLFGFIAFKLCFY